MSPKPSNPVPQSSLAAGSTPQDEVRQRVDGAVRALVTGGDREANFRILYEAYYRRLRRFFAKKGLAPEECLDLTQETFLGILRGLGGYHHEGRFDGWLFRTATTTYLKHLRARSTAKRLGDEVPYEENQDSPSLPDSPAEQLEGMLRQEKRRAMRQAVHELPEQMRKCLTFRLYHELSYREIAVVMKLKIDTVKAHLFQARKKLRDRLGEDSLEDLDV